MELANRNTELANPRNISGRSTEDEQKIIASVIGMFGILNTYGKRYEPAIGQGWLMALRVAPTILTDEFLAAVAHWLHSEKDLPSPKDLFAWIEGQREDFEMQETLKRTAEVSQIERRRDVDQWCMAKFGRVDPTVDEVSKYMEGNPFMAIATGTQSLEADNRKPARLRKITDSSEQMAMVRAELDNRAKPEQKLEAENEPKARES